MRIQLLNGGLASQVFQYVFARYGELSNPAGGKWYFDDSEFFVGNSAYNGYELEKVFGIKANLLSNAFDKDVWDEYIALKKQGYSIPQIFLECGEDIGIYAETDDYNEINPFSGHVYRKLPEGGFYPDIVRMNEAANIYYHGTWVDKRWFNAYRDVFLKELAFPEITGMQARIYEEQIKNEYAVAVHIRRGNYVDKGLLLSCEYYHDALKQLAEDKKDYKVYVFSDDLFWCNQHSFELGFHFAPQVEYVSGNIGTGSYVDLYLMSICKGIVMANSAFSYLAALIAKDLDFVVEPQPGILK